MTTDRLTLRPVTEADAPLLRELDSDPEVRRFVGLAEPFPLERYVERIRVWSAYGHSHPGYGFFAAEERDGRAFVGWLHLRPALDYAFAAETGYAAGEFDVGFRLRRDRWNRGYATEAAAALLARAAGDPTVSRVVACALATNAASLRVLHKLGLRERARVALLGSDVPAIVLAAECA